MFWPNQQAAGSHTAAATPDRGQIGGAAAASGGNARWDGLAHLRSSFCSMGQTCVAIGESIVAAPRIPLKLRRHAVRNRQLPFCL